MFKMIKGFIEDLLAILFTGSILTFGVSEAYFLMEKAALTKAHRAQSSLSKFTEALTCQKFDDKMHIEKSSSGRCK